MTDEENPKGLRLVSDNSESSISSSENNETNPQLDGANDEAIKMRIAEFEQEHRDLDVAIDTLEERMPYDRLTIQRLKKKKLQIKDEIKRLQDNLFPDIIA